MENYFLNKKWIVLQAFNYETTFFTKLKFFSKIFIFKAIILHVLQLLDLHLIFTSTGKRII